MLFFIVLNVTRNSKLFLLPRFSHMNTIHRGFFYPKQNLLRLPLDLICLETTFHNNNNSGLIFTVIGNIRICNIVHWYKKIILFFLYSVFSVHFFFCYSDF